MQSRAPPAVGQAWIELRVAEMWLDGPAASGTICHCHLYVSRFSDARFSDAGHVERKRLQPCRGVLVPEIQRGFLAAWRGTKYATCRGGRARVATVMNGPQPTGCVLLV